MKIIKPNNAYAITTVIVLVALLIEQLLWTFFRPSDVFGVGGVLFITILSIADCKKYWNVIYYIDDEKITFKYGNQKQVTTIFWKSVITAKSFGWKYCPLAWKTFIISDGMNKIPIRMIGLREYGFIWIFVYDRIKECSPSAITNISLDKTIQKMKRNDNHNKTGDNKTGDGSE